MGLFDKFKKIANDVFDDNLSKAPLFVKEIIEKKEVVISKGLIEERLKDKVKSVEVTKNGILISVESKSPLVKMDISFCAKVVDIDLEKLTIKFLIKDLQFETSKEANLFQSILTKILLLVAASVIEGIIKDKIKSLSNEEIKIDVNYPEIICDFSNVKKAKLITQKIPLINKSLAELVRVKEIEHLDGGIKIKFDLRS